MQVIPVTAAHIQLTSLVSIYLFSGTVNSNYLLVCSVDSRPTCNLLNRHALWEMQRSLSWTTTSYYNADILVNLYKYKEKLAIWQSMGIIVIKSKETRVITYTWRYFSGHLRVFMAIWSRTVRDFVMAFVLRQSVKWIHMVLLLQYLENAYVMGICMQKQPLKVAGQV